MFTDNNSNADDKKSKKDVLEIMKDLQPVAYLLSVCLVIAAFYVNPQNGVAKINLTNILMASIFFFLAYLGLFFSEKTEFILFRYFGETSLVGGAIFTFKSFEGIAEIIDKAAIATNGLYVAFCLFSFCLIIILYLLEKTKNGVIRDFCKMFFHLSAVLFCIYTFLVIFVLQTGFQISILAGIIKQVYSLLWITLKVSLFPLIIIHYWEIPTSLKINNLFTELKSADILNMSPIISLEVIAPSVAGTLLLIDTPSIFGVRIGLIAILALNILFVAGFCLTWRREIVARVG